MYMYYVTSHESAAKGAMWYLHIIDAQAGRGFGLVLANNMRVSSCEAMAHVSDITITITSWPLKGGARTEPT